MEKMVVVASPGAERARPRSETGNHDGEFGGALTRSRLHFAVAATLSCY